MNILFVADPLESFKIYKDTTFAMMREAQRRGHRISACEPADMSWQTGAKVTAQVRHITLTGDAGYLVHRRCRPPRCARSHRRLRCGGDAQGPAV
jgi:hypothetical protein